MQVPSSSVSQEQELISFKIKSLQNEAKARLPSTSAEAKSWLVKYGLSSQIPSVPRYDQLSLLLSITKQYPNIQKSLFSSHQHINELLEQCNNLYDCAFIMKQWNSQMQQQTSQPIISMVLNKLEKQVHLIFEQNQDSEAIMYLQGLHMFISMSQSSNKEPAATFVGIFFDKQRVQAGKIYQFVLKPLFQKKNLKPLYGKLVDLVSWLVLLEPSNSALINDLSKKLNSFILYHKSDTSIEMISVCSRLFDLLSVHFPRQSHLNHNGLAALLYKLKQHKLDYFIDLWLEARIGFINTIDFQFLLRNMTLLGAGSTVLSVLTRLWAYMKANRIYGVLLRIFSGYIRKEYLKLWLQRGQELSRYVKLAKYFMVGLCNRQRFQGEEIDQLTHNLGRHLVLQNANFSLVYRQIIQFYALYENRFSYLSQTSKRFYRQIKQRYNTTIETAMIHRLFEEFTIRELNFEDGDEDLWATTRGKVSLRYRGLQNMGNTCYINAFMQCLFMTRKFRGFVHAITKDDALPSDKLKVYALHNLFVQLSKKQLHQQGAFRPQYFRVELPSPFNDSPHQQDSGQFGRIYLQMLSKQLGSQISPKLDKMLAQKLIKSLRCLRCGSEKRQHERVFDLILAIDRKDSVLYLSRLLQQYFQAQKLTGDNKVSCDKCKSKQQAVAQLIPDKLSQVMVLTLSIFDYLDQEGGRKILTPLSLQFTLNLQSLLHHSELGQYQLYAFIVHIGSHLGGGHYICYARNVEENPIMWYCMDDGYVTQREIGKVEEFGFGQTQTPYMLFYSKKMATRGNKNMQSP